MSNEKPGGFLAALLQSVTPQMQESVNGLANILKPFERMLAMLVEIERPPEAYNVIPGLGRKLTATDTYLPSNENNTAKFAVDSRRVDVTLFTNDAIISLSRDGSQWGDDIFVVSPSVYSFPYKGRAIRIRNATAGLNADWQVAFWA